MTGDLTKILVVEDDRDFRDNLSDFLKSAGYDVLALETVVEFQEKIKNNRFDVALIDVNLPDGSGHQIARFLRNSSLTRIVILTARGAESDRLESYAAGADIHLLKPVSVKELRAIVEMLLARLSEVYELSGLNSEAEFGLSIGEWVLKPVPATLVSPSGKFIELNLKDYLLIQQIMSSNGQPQTGDYLLRKTKFTERLGSTSQLIERISALNEEIEATLSIGSPIKYIPNEGFVFSGS